MYKVGIITASDKASAGERMDQSAGVIEEYMNTMGWSVVSYKVVPDEFEVLRQELAEAADGIKLDLILTTGGTGFGPRDITPEATSAVIERPVPGIPEAMRLGSLKKTPRAMLSRATAGIRGCTLIVNLPGSPRAVRECLDIIVPALAHGLEILSGRGGECARG